MDSQLEIYLDFLRFAREYGKEPISDFYDRLVRFSQIPVEQMAKDKLFYAKDDTAGLMPKSVKLFYFLRNDINLDAFEKLLASNDLSLSDFIGHIEKMSSSVDTYIKTLTELDSHAITRLCINENIVECFNRTGYIGTIDDFEIKSDSPVSINDRNSETGERKLQLVKTNRSWISITRIGETSKDLYINEVNTLTKIKRS